MATGDIDVKKIWKKIFDDLAQKDGKMEWKDMEKALKKMEMKITIGELEAMELKTEKMDFETFFGSIQSGVSRRHAIRRGAMMVEKKQRENESYSKDFESTLQEFIGSQAVQNAIDAQAERFGDPTKWSLCREFENHPDFVVDGAIVQVYRYLPDGYLLLSMMCVCGTKDEEFYIAKRKELQAKLDREVLDNESWLQKAAKKQN